VTTATKGKRHRPPSAGATNEQTKNHFPQAANPIKILFPSAQTPTANPNKKNCKSLKKLRSNDYSSRHPTAACQYPFIPTSGWTRGEASEMGGSGWDGGASEER